MWRSPSTQPPTIAHCTRRSLARESLTSAGIAVEMISDNAVGCRLSRGRGAGSGKVDFCLVGAEGVVESGGVVNKVSCLHSAPRALLLCTG
jgi:methylthioribose-1-phosphate isomerase